MKRETGMHDDFLMDIINAIPNPFYVIDVKDYTIKMANRRAYPGELRDVVTCHSLTHRSDTPCDSNEHPCPLRRVVETGKPVIVEHKHFDAEGVLKNVEVHGYPIFDRKGNLVQCIETTVDITERKRAEREINFLASIIRNISCAVYAVDVENVITFWNSGAERMLGFTAKEVVGKPLDSVLPAQKRNEAAPGGQGGGDGETTLTAKDGTKIPVEITLVATGGEGYPYEGCAYIAKDITDRKKAEEELIKTRKLESISILAGGIAHDFNNLLTAIISCVSLAEDSITCEDELHEILTTAHRASRQAKDLTRQLLIFSGSESSEREIFSPADMVKDTVSAVLKGSAVQPVFRIEAPLGFVEADTDQIAQVVKEITLNAKEAMPEGGEVIVGAHNLFLENGRIPFIPEGTYAAISVTDHGPGIPEEMIRNIFDPYFTTKNLGVQKGMGLGLAICYTIVKNHGGHIAVESAQGTGTTITVYLPVTDKTGVIAG